jgi:hypothetical protein
VADGTAVFSVPQPDTVTGIVPQDELGFPDIPGVTYNGVITTRYLFDFGPEFDSEGIISLYPPDFVGAPTYPSAVSKTDEDGNELAGIRLPTVAAPIATTTGWALRREGFSLDDGCESAGQKLETLRRRPRFRGRRCLGFDGDGAAPHSGSFGSARRLRSAAR